MENARHLLKEKNFKAAERVLNLLLHGEALKNSSSSIHEATLLQSYALCNMAPLYSDSYSLSFETDFVSRVFDVSEARLKCSLNWLAKALSIALSEGNSAQVKNVSIAFLEIGKTCLLLKPDVFVHLGRSLGEALQKLDDNVFLKWRAFFHAIMAYVELLFAGCCCNEHVYEQLKIAGNLSRKNSSSIHNYMKIFCMIARKSVSFTSKWEEQEITKCTIMFLQKGNLLEMDKINDFIMGDRLENQAVSLYCDSTWLSLELIKGYLSKEQYEKSSILYKRIRDTNSNGGNFDSWINYIKDALSIATIKNQDISSILKPLENMGKIIMSASLEGNHDFVVSGAAILWNLTFPKLKESPQRIEIIRIFETVLKALCKYRRGSGILGNCFESEISKYYGVQSSSTSESVIANASYSLNIATTMSPSKALIILADSIRLIQASFKFEKFAIRLQQLKTKGLILKKAQIMLLIDISRNCFKMMAFKSLKNDEKSQLEDLLVFSNDLLLHSNAIEAASSVGINLETIFEIMMIQCDGLVRRALSMLIEEKGVILDKTMEYGLDICQKALAISVKADLSWMSHNAIAQFWKLFSELFHSFPSEQWNDPIAKMYETVISQEDMNHTIKSLVAVMYVNTQLESYSVIASKTPALTSKGNNSAISTNLKNAEEALKILTNLKDENLGTIILLIPCWIKFHHLKNASNGTTPIMELDDPVLKTIANFEILQKDQSLTKTVGNLMEYLESTYLNLKALDAIPANFQIRICLKLAKQASEHGLFDFSFGMYSKVLDCLDNIEFQANSYGLYDLPETELWISTARFDTYNRYVMDILAAEKPYNIYLLRRILDTYRKQCVNEQITAEILQGTIKCIWNYSVSFVNNNFGYDVVDVIAKFLARTVKTFAKSEGKFKAILIDAVGQLESEILIDFISICVEYYLNLGNKRLAVEILDSSTILVSSPKLIAMKSKLIQHISKRKLLDYRSCLIFAKVLNDPVESNAIFKQAISLAMESVEATPEKKQFVIDVLSSGYFSKDLDYFLNEEPSIESDSQYLIAFLTFETKMAECVISDRTTQLDRLGKLVSLYINQVLKSAEFLRAEQLSNEKPVGKGEGKKGMNDTSQNIDFSFPTKWDNYSWPKQVRSVLGQKKKHFAQNPYQFIDNLLLIAKLFIESNRVADCYPFLYLAEALAECWFETKAVFKVAIYFFHTSTLKKHGGNFENKARQSYAELDEKMDQILVSITSADDFNQAKYHFILSDTLLEWGDSYRSNLLMSNLKNVAKLFKNKQIQAKCLLRLAKIQKTPLSIEAKRHLKESLLNLEKTSVDYLDAFKLIYSSVIGQGYLNDIDDLLLITFQNTLEQVQLEAQWLCLIVDIGIREEFQNQRIISILDRLYRNCATRHDFKAWSKCIQKFLQNIVDTTLSFSQLQKINSFYLELPLENLEENDALESAHLIILINTIYLIRKGRQNGPQISKINLVEKFLLDTDPELQEKKNCAEPGLIESVDKLLNKLGDSIDSHWISLFSVGMLNYIKWKMSQSDADLKYTVISNLSKLVEETKLKAQFMTLALDSLVTVLHDSSAGIKYLCFLQNVLFRQEKEVQKQSPDSFQVPATFSPILPKNTCVLLLQYSLDEKAMFGGFIFIDFEKKISAQSCLVETPTNDHARNTDLCLSLLKELEPLKIESAKNIHLVVCADIKVLSFDVESLLHEKLLGVKSISIEFSLDNLISRLQQIGRSHETKVQEATLKKTDKKKEKDMEEKKAIELDPEALSISAFGAIVKCCSFTSCTFSEEALERVFKAKENVLIGEDYSIEELKAVFSKNLIVFLLDKPLDVEALSEDLTGKVVIALNYSFGDQDSHRMTRIAMKLCTMGAYSCVVPKSILSENEMIEEAEKVLQIATEGQGFIRATKRVRWFGPRFQIIQPTESS